jgi:hypothetical protein
MHVGGELPGKKMQRFLAMRLMVIGKVTGGSTTQIKCFSGFPENTTAFGNTRGEWARRGKDVDPRRPVGKYKMQFAKSRAGGKKVANAAAANRCPSGGQCTRVARNWEGKKYRTFFLHILLLRFHKIHAQMTHMQIGSLVEKSDSLSKASILHKKNTAFVFLGAIEFRRIMKTSNNLLCTVMVCK